MLPDLKLSSTYITTCTGTDTADQAMARLSWLT